MRPKEADLNGGRSKKGLDIGQAVTAGTAGSNSSA